MEYPANEDITHDFSQDSAKKDVLEGENSMEYPANEDITHDISHDSAEKDFSDDENSTEYPANEDITSNPHACVRVNTQTDEQTNEQTNEQEKEERRKIFSLPSLFSEEEGSGTQTDEEVKTCEDESGSTKACSDSCERKARACSTTLKVPLKRSVAMPKKGSVRGV